MTYNIKTGKEKILRIWITIIGHGGSGHEIQEFKRGTLLTLFNSVLRFTLNVCLTMVTLTKRLKRTQYKQTVVKPGRFYILPYIHKTGNPGRPIVSSNSHLTERISQFVDYHINPLVPTLESHIKDTTDILNKPSNLGNLPNNAILVTLDVSSLYTNIPHNQRFDACRHFLDTPPYKTHPHRDTM